MISIVWSAKLNIGKRRKTSLYINISKEDQEEEDEYRREFKDDSRPMWSCGGWVPKPDDDERPLHHVSHRTMLLPTRDGSPQATRSPRMWK